MPFLIENYLGKLRQDVSPLGQDTGFGRTRPRWRSIVALTERPKPLIKGNQS